MERNIVRRMVEAGIYPSDRLGQHILVNESALEVFAGNVLGGGNVIEIGAGPGNITERIAQRAKRVVAVEFDKKFEPILSQLRSEHSNVDVVYKDALSINLGNLMKGGWFDSGWQIMSNLPFHITEPFLKKLIDLPINDATLILGEQMVGRIRTDNPLSFDFTRTGLTVQTFFESSVLMNLPSSYFYPEPGTDSAIVILTPRSRAEYQGNRKLSILRHLFLTEHKHPSIGKVIKEISGRVDDNVFRDKEERNRYDRRRAGQEIRAMLKNGDLARRDESSSKNEILNRAFSSLDNQDLRELVLALDKL